ncbi:MAG TPA: hypothetical protein VMZ32_05420 [Gammaproteobacteria bacterium]|nr:hypothetical protein [Gammaproteobacteria bacterium]
MKNRQARDPRFYRLNTYIDLDRYPLHEPDSSAGKALITQAQQMMARDTLCLLDGFLREAAVSALSAEITPLEAEAHQLDYLCTPYGWMNNASFPPDHPRSQLLERSCSTITTEMLNPGGACMELYGFDELTEFVRRLLNYDTLYRTACPTLSVQINIMDERESFGWHFDTNDGVVSFTIQNADNGGGFEYAPLIRAEDDENYAAVTRILSGADKPQQPRQTPGTLSLFLGRRSLHRSAPVGPTLHKRQSLLFSYDRNPGVVFPEMTCRRLTQGSPEPYLGALTPTN